MTIESPFIATRFEHLTTPVIWLPPTISRLEGERSAYLSGSRGTGKTTLLKALSYKMRLGNDSLRSHLGDDPFSRRYIGLYLRLPDYVTRSFSRWGDKFSSRGGTGAAADGASVGSDLLLEQAFSLMLELQIAQLLFTALGDLRDEHVVRVSSTQEERAAWNATKYCEPLFRFNNDRAPLRNDSLSLTEKLLVSTNSNATINAAEQRRGSVLTELNVARGLLAQAEHVELSRIVQPGVAVRTSATSRRNAAVVGALAGLLLGALAAIVADPWLRRRSTSAV